MRKKDHKSQLPTDACVERDRLFRELLSDQLPKTISALKDFEQSLQNLERLKGGRARGQRTKLHAAILSEDVAVDLVKRRRNDLKERGIPPYDALEQACREIAPLFCVGPGTLQDWLRGVRRRERDRPIERRGFRRRRAKQQKSKID